MPFPKKRRALQFTAVELRKLESIRRSRTEEKRRSQRAAFLLDSGAGHSDQAIAQRYQVSRSTVVLCIRKCLEFGLDAALANYQGRANRDNCPMMRLPGCRTVPA